MNSVKKTTHCLSFSIRYSDLKWPTRLNLSLWFARVIKLIHRQARPCLLCLCSVLPSSPTLPAHKWITNFSLTSQTPLVSFLILFHLSGFPAVPQTHPPMLCLSTRTAIGLGPSFISPQQGLLWAPLYSLRTSLLLFQSSYPYLLLFFYSLFTGLLN